MLNSLKYGPWKDRNAVAIDLKAIYDAPGEAELKLLEFEEKWSGKYPGIGPIWRRNRDHVTSFFSYPAEIRKPIYTTNAVESLNMSPALNCFSILFENRMPHFYKILFTQNAYPPESYYIVGNGLSASLALGLLPLAANALAT